MILNLILIGLGGFFGSISRFLVFQLTDLFYHKTRFPLGTLAVNALGSLLIGVFLGLSIKHNLFSRHTFGHYVFVTGFLGAFTTFSTFSQDNLALLFEKNYMFFMLNILFNVFLGLGFVAMGYYLVKSS